MLIPHSAHAVSPPGETIRYTSQRSSHRTGQRGCARLPPVRAGLPGTAWKWGLPPHTPPYGKSCKHSTKEATTVFFWPGSTSIAPWRTVQGQALKGHLRLRLPMTVHEPLAGAESFKPPGQKKMAGFVLLVSMPSPQDKLVRHNT